MLWPLLLVALNSRKQAIYVTVAGTVALVIGVIVCGLASYVQWIHLALPIPAQGTFIVDNLSLSFAVLRLTGYGPWAHAWLVFAAVAGPAVVASATRRLPFEMRCAALVLAAMLFAPICWTSYLAAALILAALRTRNKKAAFSLEKEATTQAPN